MGDDIVGTSLYEQVKFNMPIIKDMKFDGGKLLAHIIFEDFPDAIKEVVRVATFGAKKYERSSWKTVANGLQRYSDAKARHFLEAAAGVDLDDESGLDHLAHEAWNALATLQLKLEQKARNAAKQLEAKKATNV